MNNSHNSTGSLVGLVIGLGIGAVAGVLFAPAEGAKTRQVLAKKIQEWAKSVENSEQYQQIKRVFGEINSSTIALYDRIQQEVIRNVEEMRLTLGSIDRQTYYTAVEKSLATFKTELDVANAQTRILREQLKAEAQRLPERKVEELETSKTPKAKKVQKSQKRVVKKTTA